MELFSEYLDSNVMIGPVLSQSAGNSWQQYGEANLPDAHSCSSVPSVNFIPFDPTTLYIGCEEADMPEVTDAFVAAAFFSKDSQPMPRLPICTKYHATEPLGYQEGQPTIGVSKEPIDSVALGAALAKASSGTPL